MDYKKDKDFKKFTLVYCGELIGIALILGVVSILYGTKVIPMKPHKYWVFPILTLLGGIWFIIDFIWYLCSAKKRAKNSLIDKLLPFPCSLAVTGLDIYFIINNILRVNYESMFRIVITIVLGYYAIIFLFEGIYHYFIPSKSLTSAYEQALKEAAIQEAMEKEKQNNEKPEDSNTNS